MITESALTTLDSKDKSRTRYARTNRTQDHGTRGNGNSRRPSGWGLEFAPGQALRHEAMLRVETAIGLAALSISDQPPEVTTHEVYDDEDIWPDYSSNDAKFESAYVALDDPTSDEYENAYDTLADLLDAYEISDDDRKRALYLFESDRTIREALLDLAVQGVHSPDDYVGDENIVPSISPRSRTDYHTDGTFEDDEGDYIIPSMSIRTIR